MKPFALAIHGGAGTISPQAMTPEKKSAYRQALQEAVEVGYAMLEKGGTALEAVEEAVKNLEDCPLFNAGRGSVFTRGGHHEMDAAIMCGKTLDAGAIAGVRNTRNPISLAGLVLRQSDHVFLSGPGAEAFGQLHQVVTEPDAYFYTAHRYEQWQQVRDSDVFLLDHSEEKKFGTVGAVAVDQAGNLAAATSTGGMTNKSYNRIGDTPIIGAGTYANNRSCAVSCTGHGELFIRAVVAYDVSCLMEYKGLSLAEACEVVVQDKLVQIGGEGGLIAVDTAGNIAMPFNSEGMYRAAKRSGEEAVVGIF
ncbi:beta-aspartyl-peptidase [soil metagenome]